MCDTATCRCDQCYTIRYMVNLVNLSSSVSLCVPLSMYYLYACSLYLLCILTIGQVATHCYDMLPTEYFILLYCCRRYRHVKLGSTLAAYLYGTEREKLVAGSITTPYSTSSDLYFTGTGSTVVLGLPYAIPDTV